MNTVSFRLFLLLILSLLMWSCNRDEDPDPTDIGPASGAVLVIQDQFQGQDIVLVGSEGLNFATSFFNTDQEVFTAIQDKLPVVMQSEDGTEWDAFGVAVAGPREGERLEGTNSLMGFWMTFGAFYPGVEIYEGKDPNGRESIEESDDPAWSIPQNRVFDGGPGKDGIPSLEDIIFSDPEGVSYLDPGDLIVGYKVGDDVRAYPHKILDWHEIANDVLDDTMFVSITYCPLTGTASGWNRKIDGQVTTFGVSGLLYNTNLIPYDRATDSYWSQMRFDCVNGARQGKVIETVTLIETTWQTWLTMYPNTQVVTTETGFNRNYERYPYGDYRTNDRNLIFPLEFDDNRLDRKQRVHGVIINGEAKVYPLDVF